MKWTVADITLNHATKVKAPFEIQQEGKVSFTYPTGELA